MGFIAMMISPIPMIQSFGLVCVIGVVSCYCVALIAVPTVGVLFKYRPKTGERSGSGDAAKSHKIEVYNNFIGTVAEKVARNPVPILILCALIAVIGFQMDNEIIINTNEDTFVPADMPAISTSTR